jgi:pilus assembly protein Flp/PilA
MNMNLTNPTLSRLLRDETGQDMIEYALIAALIGISAIASTKILSTRIASAYASIATTLTSVI